MRRSPRPDRPVSGRPRLAEEDGLATLELRVALVIVCLILLVPITSFASLRRNASDTSARVSLQAALTQVEAFRLQHGTYTGLTTERLDDRGRRRGKRPLYALTRLSATTFCISSTVGDRSWMKVGPSGRVVRGTCSA